MFMAAPTFASLVCPSADLQGRRQQETRSRVKGGSGFRYAVRVSAAAVVAVAAAVVAAAVVAAAVVD